MMKTFSIPLVLAFAVMWLSGCSTPDSVRHLHGRGSRGVYDADFNRVWSAAVAAAQTGDLQILNTDKAHGFISARRGLQPTTFGENVAIWVRNVSPTETEVEVVSRQAGPPVLMFRDWEKRILNAIAADLTT